MEIMPLRVQNSSNLRLDEFDQIIRLNSVRIV